VNSSILHNIQFTINQTARLRPRVYTIYLLLTPIIYSSPIVSYAVNMSILFTH
jgi:hypothetical protein